MFEEKRRLRTTQQIKKIIFYLTSTKGADASGEPTSDGFVVFKGSKAAIKTTDSMPSSLKRLRDQLIENRSLKKGEGYYYSAEDLVLSSPSTAASIFLGRNANGPEEWKMKDSTTLKAFEGGE